MSLADASGTAIEGAADGGAQKRKQGGAGAEEEGGAPSDASAGKCSADCEAGRRNEADDSRPEQLERKQVVRGGIARNANCDIDGRHKQRRQAQGDAGEFRGLRSVQPQGEAGEEGRNFESPGDGREECEEPDAEERGPEGHPDLT